MSAQRFLNKSLLFSFLVLLAGFFYLYPESRKLKRALGTRVRERTMVLSSLMENVDAAQQRFADLKLGPGPEGYLYQRYNEIILFSTQETILKSAISRDIEISMIEKVSANLRGLETELVETVRAFLKAKADGTIAPLPGSAPLSLPPGEIHGQ